MMFSLLMAGAGWEDNHDTFGPGRVFEYTAKDLSDRFMPGGVMDLNAITEIPAVFATETSHDDSQAPARVATITKVKLVGSTYHLDYVYDPDIPPIPNAILRKMANELGIDASGGIDEFSRTHWAVKHADLFKALLKRNLGARPKPKVFTLSSDPVDPNLVAVMMPFSAEFNGVYAALQQAMADRGLTCQRADDIWIHDHVIQDVVTLLCKAGTVICDLTGRNSNVFYEMGIAHALAREVIMITQNPQDVPFDVQHIRHIRYLNNLEGLQKLIKDVQGRLATLQATLA